MFKLSKRTAAATHAEAGDSVMQAANSSRPSQAHQDIQRELIRVAFKDTMRNTGVPAAWLGCEVRTRPGPGGVEQMEVHLVMKEWSGHLLRYALAFQKQFQHCLDRYEPTVDHKGYEWIWRFGQDCNTPFPTMPEPEEWAQKLEARKNRSVSEKIQTVRAAIRKTPTTAVKNVPTLKPEKEFDLRDVFSDLKA